MPPRLHRALPPHAAPAARAGRRPRGRLLYATAHPSGEARPARIDDWMLTPLRDTERRAVRAVGLDLSRRSSKAPYSPSLEQVVAEADRQVARERREPDRHPPRSEAAPMTHTRPARRPLHRAPPPTHGRPATASTGPKTWSLPGPRRTSRRPALRRHPPPLVSDSHRLADTLAQALPPLSNRTLSSLLRRLDGDHAIDAAARAALRLLRTVAPTTRRGPPPSAAITTARSGPRSSKRRPAESPRGRAAPDPRPRRAGRTTAARRADPHPVPAGLGPRPGRRPQPARHPRLGTAGPDAPGTSSGCHRRAERGPPRRPPRRPQPLTRRLLAGHRSSGLGATSTARRTAAGSTPSSPPRGAAGPSRPVSASPRPRARPSSGCKQARTPLGALKDGGLVSLAIEPRP